MPSTELCAFIFLACALTLSDAQATCKGRCGAEYYRGNTCQCDYSCLSYGECCRDYEAQCTTRNSCKGRCGETFKRGRLCSCDSDCMKYNQCCPDYKDHCDVDVMTTEDISGADIAATPVPAKSCHNVNDNKPKDPTLTGATDPDFSEGNDADDQLIPMVSPTSYPPNDVSDNQDFLNDGSEDPEASPIPESTSGYGSSTADLLDPPSAEPTLDPDLGMFSTEGVTVSSPSDVEPTQADDQASTLDPTTEAAPTDSPDANDATNSPDLEADTAMLPTGDSPVATTQDLETTAETTGPTTASSDGPEATTLPVIITAANQPADPVTVGPTEASTVLENSEIITSDSATMGPTTIDLTTIDLTTKDPTTKDPTTIDPTTMDPTTMDLTTIDLTTKDPTTKDPTTMGPTTMDPTTIQEATTPNPVPEVTTGPPATSPEGAQSTIISTSTDAVQDETTTGTTADPQSVTQDLTTTDAPSTPEVKPPPVKPTPAKPSSKPETKPQDNARDYQADDNNDTNLCSGRPVGAVTTLRNGTIVVFRGHYFWFLDPNREPGPARGITEVWGVPSPIDTVFTRCNCQGKTYILKGRQYWRYENDVLDSGYPKVTEVGFDGLKGQVTAALSVPQNRRRRESVYFFKRGGVVQKYSYQFGTSPTCGRKPQYAIFTTKNRVARQAVSGLEPAINIRMSWRGFPSTVTAAVSIPSKTEPDGYKYHVFSRTKSYTVRMDTGRPVIAVLSANTSPQSNNVFKCSKKV